MTGQAQTTIHKWDGTGLTKRQELVQQFLYPRATFIRRDPIGTEQTITAADAAALAAFWHAHYRPDRTTLVIVGDLPVDAMERAVAAHFADWRADPAPAPSRMAPGTIDPARADLVDMQIDPSLAESISVTRHG